MSSVASPAARTASARRPAAVPRRRSGIVFVLLCAAASIAFGVSGGLLWTLGINYDGLTGSAAAKVHPSTYLLVLAFGVTALRSGNPARYIHAIFERRPAAVFLCLAAMISLVDLKLRQGAGLAGVVDTFIAAALCAVLMMELDDRQMSRVALLVHLVMTGNAVLGLYEFASDVRLFPFRFDGEIFPLDTRSSALQGHPLANAAVTCLYIVTLIATRGASLPRWARWPMLGLQFAGLVTFGGRTGLVVAVALGVILGLGRAAGAIRHRRLPLMTAAAGLIALMTLLLVVGVLFEGGFFSAIMRRFASDGGSAQARIQMFDMFDGLTWRDLLVGPDPSLIDSTRRILGLEWGIENPFIKTLLYQGLVITLMMTVAVLAFLYELAEAAGPGTLGPMLGFAILALTSESIGGKTTLLTKFTIMLLCLYAPLRARRAAAATGRR